MYTKGALRTTFFTAMLLGWISSMDLHTHGRTLSIAESLALDPREYEPADRRIIVQREEALFQMKITRPATKRGFCVWVVMTLSS